MAEKIYSGEIGSSWEAAKLAECVAFGVSYQSIEACLSSAHPLFVQPSHQQKLEIKKAAHERQTIKDKAMESYLAEELLSRSRLSDERRKQSERAARTRERDAAASESVAALANKQCEIERLQNRVKALRDRLRDLEVAEACMEISHRDTQTIMDERAKAAEAHAIKLMVEHAEGKKRTLATTSALKKLLRGANKNSKKRFDRKHLRSRVSAEANEGDTEEVASLKKKLAAARKARRALEKKQRRVSTQSQNMTAKCKELGRQRRRVELLEAKLEECEILELDAHSAPPGRRDVELFSMKRDYTKHGAPYDKVFSDVIAPAMLTTGASGEQIAEILRKYIPRYMYNCILC
jgi:hypothetical protein